MVGTNGSTNSGGGGSGRAHFRSQTGCCICGTKSSSSRFTASQRYSEHFGLCFGPEGAARSGDLCNACVLCVKRWLQRSKKPNCFVQVLDSKKGPGPKHMKEIIKRARRRESKQQAGTTQAAAKTKSEQVSLCPPTSCAILSNASHTPSTANAINGAVNASVSLLTAQYSSSSTNGLDCSARSTANGLSSGGPYLSTRAQTHEIQHRNHSKSSVQHCCCCDGCCFPPTSVASGRSRRGQTASGGLTESKALSAGSRKTTTNCCAKTVHLDAKMYSNVLHQGATRTRAAAARQLEAETALAHNALSFSTPRTGHAHSRLADVYDDDDEDDDLRGSVGSRMRDCSYASNMSETSDYGGSSTGTVYSRNGTQDHRCNCSKRRCLEYDSTHGSSNFTGTDNINTSNNCGHAKHGPKSDGPIGGTAESTYCPYFEFRHPQPPPNGHAAANDDAKHFCCSLCLSSSSYCCSSSSSSSASSTSPSMQQPVSTNSGAVSADSTVIKPARRYNRRVVLPPVRMTHNAEVNLLLREIMERNSQAVNFDSREMHMAVQQELRLRSRTINAKSTASGSLSGRASSISSTDGSLDTNLDFGTGSQTSVSARNSNEGHHHHHHKCCRTKDATNRSSHNCPHSCDHSKYMDTRGSKHNNCVCSQQHHIHGRK